jgi:hypothetical protein
MELTLNLAQTPFAPGRPSPSSTTWPPKPAGEEGILPRLKSFGANIATIAKRFHTRRETQKKRQPWPQSGKGSIMADPSSLWMLALRARAKRRFSIPSRRPNVGRNVSRSVESTRVYPAYQFWPPANRAFAYQRRLEPFNASLSTAVDFFVRHPQAGRWVSEFLNARRGSGRREDYLRIEDSVLAWFSKSSRLRLRFTRLELRLSSNGLNSRAGSTRAREVCRPL